MIGVIVTVAPEVTVAAGTAGEIVQIRPVASTAVTVTVPVRPVAAIVSPTLIGLVPEEAATVMVVEPDAARTVVVVVHVDCAAPVLAC